MKMKISIITVTYNSASYVYERITSVNNQSSRDIEHIIMIEHQQIIHLK